MFTAYKYAKLNWHSWASTFMLEEEQLYTVQCTWSCRFQLNQWGIWFVLLKNRF